MSKLALIFDLDNTLYPRSSGLGRAMGDRIVEWVRRNVDLSKVDESKLPSAKEVDSSYNHPPDIDATDELVERMCLDFYNRFGLTVVGLVEEMGIGPEQEQDYLDFISHPSTELEKYMPHRQEHVKLVELLNAIRTTHADAAPLYIFSNGHRDHVDRVIDHLGVPRDWFSGCLEYYQLKSLCKPHPKSYESMLQMVRATATWGGECQPHQCLFFDDSKANLRAAKQMGMETVYVSGGHGDHEHKEAFIDHVVDDVRSIEKMTEILRHYGLDVKI